MDEKMDDITPAIRGKRGRPSTGEFEKKPKNLSISNVAFKGLEKIVTEFQLKSVSELCEQIGLGDLKISPKESSESSKESSESSLDEIPIYQRLKSLISEPIAVFGSILAFTWRTALQLELVEEEEEVKELTIKSIPLAISIIFYIGYLYPDCYINNPSALMRYLIYKIFIEYAKTRENKNENFQSIFSNIKFIEDKVENNLYHTNQNITNANNVSSLSCLRMKTLNGLTVSQIITRLKIDQSLNPKDDGIKQQNNIAREKLRQDIKAGLVGLRSFSSPPVGENIESFWDSSNDNYYKLAVKYPLKENADLEKLEKTLLSAIHNTSDDFWLNEVDYHFVRELYNYGNTKNFGAYVSDTSRKILQNLKGESIAQKKGLADIAIFAYQTKSKLEKELIKLIDLEVKNEFAIKINLDIWSLLDEKVFELKYPNIDDEIRN
jgi:hypothetical protein